MRNWRPRAKRRISVAEPLEPSELLAEVHWLLDGYMHPLMIAQQLGKTVKAVYATAWREKDERVMSAFGSYQQVGAKPRKKKRAKV